jgi:hypothetical protein
MDLKHIIVEELNKLITESVSMEHENFKFRQNLKDSQFYNYSGFSQDFDIEINESSVNVNWHIAFWLNDLGVENFIVVVDSVDGLYRLDMNNKQTDVLEQQTDKDIAEIQWKFIIEDAVLRMNEQLYVESLEFDFATNSCKVYFYDSE